MTAAPVNPQIPADIERFLLSQGWYKVRGRMWGHENGGNIVVTEAFVNLADRLFLNGFAQGLNRGCYETMTMEDA